MTLLSSKAIAAGERYRKELERAYNIDETAVRPQPITECIDFLVAQYTEYYQYCLDMIERMNVTHA